jgi:ribosome-associated protein
VTTDGVLIIDSREHRTQLQNRETARARLVALVRAACRRPRRRVPTKPKAGAREERLATKKRHGKVKALRGKRGVSDGS